MPRLSQAVLSHRPQLMAMAVGTGFAAALSFPHSCRAVPSSNGDGGHGLIVTWAGAVPQLEEYVWVLCGCLKPNKAGQNWSEVPCRSVSTKQEGDGHTGQQSISTFLFFNKSQTFLILGLLSFCILYILVKVSLH